MRRIVPLLILFIALVALAFVFLFIPSNISRAYGPPASWLTFGQVIQYSMKLYWYDGLLTEPFDNSAPEQTLVIEQGESVSTIAVRLKEKGLIHDASVFRDYLIYTGLDTSIQAGEFQLSPSMSIVDIARELQDATPAEVKFVILPGWRMEEIAASLSTSGLDITPDAFMEAASTPPRGFDFLFDATTTEGFLYPDSYVLSREISADTLIETFVRGFPLHLTNDLIDGFSRQGLSIYQAVTLASIVEREAVKDEEAPLIASVYLNRWNIGMKLDADPTVQYALGFNPIQQTWWTNPLSPADLQVASPYNTYAAAGLPPSPISNPGLIALHAVAFPAETPYYYFRARCDGSGLHVFAETFEEHIANACP